MMIILKPIILAIWKYQIYFTRTLSIALEYGILEGIIEESMLNVPQLTEVDNNIHAQWLTRFILEMRNIQK